MSLPETTPKSESFLRGVVQTLSDLGSSLARTARVAMSSRDTRSLTDLCRALLSERGESSGIAFACDGIARYQALNAGERRQFFDALVRDFSPDPTLVKASATAYGDDTSQRNLIALQRAVEAPHQELFRRFNMAPGGTAALVEMRRELLTHLDANPELAGLDAGLSHLFVSWFNRGFLELRRIDWNTPAAVLEKLIKYEAVHEMHGWEDLRRRLDRDRRCFAFFHPALPDEPLIFVEVALVQGMSAAVQPLLAADNISDARKANCAVFYSITNCQDGLRGISFGSFLIKQVAAELGRELPRIKTFVTLSPLPGYRRWLEHALTALEPGPREAQWSEIPRLLKTPNWHQDPAIVAQLETPLTQLCAWYLLHAKRASNDSQLPLDPVARFHLSNGARLERINWLADISPKGIRESAGLMVNYLYKLEDIERNHEAFAKGEPTVASRKVESLAMRAPLPMPET